MVYGLEWLIGPSNPAPESVRPKSSDGGYVAPDRVARERCYDSRDIFFDCLDKHDILDATKHDEESRQKCPKEVQDYERDCARTWIKYFKEKRVMEFNRDQTYARIKEDDAAIVAKQKAKKGGGWFS